MPMPLQELSSGPAIELTNRSANSVEIQYGYWPYIYLTYIVMSENGEILREEPFADLASIVTKPYKIIIKPGETWSSIIHISPFVLAELAGNKFPKGTYKIQGIFRYHNLLAHSNVIPMLHLPQGP